MKRNQWILLGVCISLFMMLFAFYGRGVVSAETKPEQIQADLLRQDIIKTGEAQVGNAPAISVFTRGGALVAEDFDTTAVLALPTGWVVDNVNGDANAWTTRDSSSHSAPNSARINWNSAEAMDDWLISPSFELVSGTDYRLTFYYRVGGATFPENLAAHIGTGAAGISMTTQIVDLPGNTNITWEQSQTVFTASAAGTYYLGFHGYSDADQFYNYVDSIVLEVAPAGAPECATPNMPADTATDVPLNAVLEWAAAATGTVPTGYDFSFGTDNPPTDIVNGADVGSMTSYTPTALAFDATYYWQAVPKNADGSATGCPVWSFTVQSDLTVTTFPYLETFGDATCELPLGWLQEAANGEDWLFGVPGNATNPAEWGADADYTDGTGCIAWIDSSSPYNANPAGLVTPPMDMTALTEPILEFYFENQAAASNDASFSTLAIDVYDGSSWVTDVFTIGEKVADWTKYTVDLTSYKSAITQVRFSGTEQQAWFDSDISLDDVLIQDKPNDDVGLVSFVSPGSGCALSNSETVEVVFENFGPNPAENFEITLLINGVFQGTSLITGPLAPGASDSFAFNPSDLSAAGSYTLTVELGADDNSLNNTLETVVTNLGQTPISSLPYIESFEGTDGGWMAGGVNSSWERGAPGDTSISSAYDGAEVWATGLITDYVINEQSYVQSPCFDFSQQHDPQISLGINLDSEFSWDGAALQYSTDGAETWTPVGATGDEFIWFNDGTIAGLGWSGSQIGWSGSSGGEWLPASHQLDTLAGEPNVIFRIAFGSDGSTVGEGFAFDAVHIEDGRPAVGELTTEVSATVGMSTTNAVGIVFENAGSGTMSYSFYEGTCAVDADVPWISGFSPRTGSVDAGGIGTVSVLIDTTGMMTGTYSSTVCAFTSDVSPTRATREVTVNLVVADMTPTAVNLGANVVSPRFAAVPLLVAALLGMTAVAWRTVARRRERV